MSEKDQLFIASIKDLKRIFEKIDKSDAKWDGDKCPECHGKLKKREKILLSGTVLECPKCEIGFDRAEDFIQSGLKKLQHTEKNIENLDCKTLRNILRCEAKQNHSIKDFT